VTFHIEHIRSRKHDGTDALDNLCLACNDCNNSKGSNISGYDPLTDKPSLLYNPRNQAWDEHFRLEPDSVIIGLTSVGRTTIDVLNFNEESRVVWRRFLNKLGEYPCLPKA
jgi:hypothetical protein